MRRKNGEAHKGGSVPAEAPLLQSALREGPRSCGAGQSPAYPHPAARSVRYRTDGAHPDVGFAPGHGAAPALSCISLAARVILKAHRSSGRHSVKGASAAPLESIHRVSGCSERAELCPITPPVHLFDRPVALACGGFETFWI